MLVYGDHKETADPRDRLARVGQRLDEVRASAPGIERHSNLVAALIEAGQVLQGVADADAPSDELNTFLYRLAGAVVRSFDSGFSEIGVLPDAPTMHLPRSVELRVPEGYAFYAVYPEAYVTAARKLRLSGAPRVIGIRSIGTSLGAVVAAALGAPPPETVRPFGDPFARRVELGAETIEAGAHYVIVDEGPGLSGSSFGAVADWLQQRGVPLDRIAFLPSHGGDPGPEASAEHRERWRHAQRVAAEFAPDFLSARFGALREFSIGHSWERRKYLAGQGSARVLLKFAGLGAIGERKLEMARALHAAGFTAEPLGLVHGFLVERWCEDAQPLAPNERPVDDIGRYIGARAALFPAGDASGATMDDLLAMCRRNLSLALGDQPSRRVNDWDAVALAQRVRAVRIDGKLDRQEWLRTRDGRLLKTDALDHHCSHDLVGCQDVAWDVAGAISEFELGSGDTERLIGTVERASARKVDRELLGFYRIAYAAIRLARATMSGDGSDSRYLHQLQLLLLQGTRSATRLESSVD